MTYTAPAPTASQHARADEYQRAAERHGLLVERRVTDYGQVEVLVRESDKTWTSRLQIIVGHGIGEGPNPRPRVSAWSAFGSSDPRQVKVRYIYMELSSMGRAAARAAARATLEG
jgi:hypothetical protein